MSRQVAILGGSDWSGARCTHPTVPDEKWYNQVYRPSSKPGGPHTEKLVMFVEWPWDRGATDGTIEEFDDE